MLVICASHSRDVQYPTFADCLTCPGLLSLAHTYSSTLYLSACGLSQSKARGSLHVTFPAPHIPCPSRLLVSNALNRIFALIGCKPTGLGALGVGSMSGGPGGGSKSGAVYVEALK